MILINPLNYISQFFVNILNQLDKIYLNSSYYDRKISKVDFERLVYKPSPHLLSSLIRYQKKKINIDDFSTHNLWNNKNINSKDFKKLNNFYWVFSLDLKSSKKNTQKVLANWVKNNFKYNFESWEFDLTSKRIIAWLSNHYLTYEESDSEYQNKFNEMIQKQANHLMNVINKSKFVDDKIIGCAAIILVGLCYKDEKNYLSYGISLLKKILKSSLDNQGFPKSRSIKTVNLLLKIFYSYQGMVQRGQDINS